MTEKVKGFGKNKNEETYERVRTSVETITHSTTKEIKNVEQLRSKTILSKTILRRNINLHTSCVQLDAAYCSLSREICI